MLYNRQKTQVTTQPTATTPSLAGRLGDVLQLAVNEAFTPPRRR